jgi:hypothetical protein
MTPNQQFPLGRMTPLDFDHVDLFPLTAETAPAEPRPAVIGVNWYTDFDTPIRKDGAYWIGLNAKKLGTVRGGHCVAIEANGHPIADRGAWWGFYNQGREGACVGFGCSRMMSLLNGREYFARWLWDRAKATDEYGDETQPGDDNGTSVRAALRILRKEGHVPWREDLSRLNSNDAPAVRERDTIKGTPADGITAYRWARSTDDFLHVTGWQDRGYVEILNSWGTDYPRVVRMPAATLDRLRTEDGELGIVTDR